MTIFAFLFLIAISQVAYPQQTNYSLGFDGVDDYVEISASDALNNVGNQMTFEAWIYPHALNHNGWIIGRNNNWFLLLHNNGTINYAINYNEQWNVSADIQVNQWQHLAVTYNGSEMSFYKNGILLHSTSFSQDIMVHSDPVVIGLDAINPYNYYNGLIDEIRVWNRGLTRQEIQEKMYQSLDTASETGLIGYWQFNEGQSNTAYDVSSNENHGTIHGAAWSMDVPFYEDYFSPVAPTGLPYNIVVESVSINNNSLLPGDQIGVFDDTLCVGVITVSNSVDDINLVAWQSDPNYNLPGFTPGNPITFKILSRIYGPSEVFDPSKTYSIGDGTFGYGSYSVVSLDITTIDVPELTLNTAGIVFDPTPIYTTSTDSFTIQNDGDRNLVITDISSDNSAFTTSFSGSVIIPHSDSKIIYVTFSPDQKVHYSATLTIISNDQSGSTNTISISGLGTEPLVPDWIGFQNILNIGYAVTSDTIQVNWTIQNSGSDTLRLWNIHTNNEHFFLKTNNYHVPPGDIYMFPVYFTPDNKGLFTADLYFSHNDPDLGQNQIRLNAIGYDGYYQSVEPTGLSYTITVDSVLVDYKCLDYGDEIGVFDNTLCVGVGVKGLDENLQITAWEEDLSHGLSGFTVGNTMTFKFRGSTFGEDREISLTPDFSQGDGSFGFQPLTVVNLSGFSGSSPIAQLSTTAITFDPTNVGYSLLETLLITNIGNAQLEANNFQFTSSAFYSNTSSFTIGPGSSNTLEIYFTPDQPVYYSEELTFNTDDPDHHSITIQLTGIGIPSLQSHLTVVNPIVEFNPTVIGDTTTAEVIIRNDGNSPLTINSITSTSNTYFADIKPLQINSGVSKVFPIHFVPDLKGNFNGSFQIYSDAGNGNVHYFSVRGTGYDGYFSSVPSTGLPYHIVIDSISTFNDSSLQIGDEIGIYDKHVCVGVGVLTNTSHESNPGALVVDGYHDYIDCGIPELMFNSTTGTMEAWVKPTQLFSDHWFFSYSMDDEHAFAVCILSNGSLGYQMNSSGVHGSSSQTAPLNQWTHIALSWNNSEVKLYLNGVLDKTINQSGYPSYSSDHLYIGIDSFDRDNYSFYGSIDEIRLWNTERNEDQIRNNMMLTILPNKPGLIGYWQINGNETSIIEDLSGAGYNGILSGNTYISSDGAPITSIPQGFTDLKVTVWKKDDSHTLAGFTEGDSITYIVRTNLDAFPDSMTDTYYASATYSEGDGLFGTGEMSVVDLITTDHKIDASFFFGSLSGSVTSNKGGTVDKVSVMLLQESEILELTTTDSAGFFFIDSLISGDYTLTLERFHFEPYSSSQPFTVKKPDTTQMDIVLTQIERIVLSVPDEFNTIQEAINETVDGDTVLVYPGTYIENINFNGKNIVVGSLFLTTQNTSYISQTIIDGNQNGSVVRFNSGEDSTAIFGGFTVQNGFSSQGGGIYCNANPTLKNLIVEKNSADQGGGIFSIGWGNSPIIDNCIITHNNGHGIFLWDSPAHIYNSQMSNNSSAGIEIYGGSTFKMVNCTITDNSSGIILGYLDQSPSITNTIIFGNTGKQVHIEKNDNPAITYSNVQDTLLPGEGNLSTVPHFFDPENGDYHLCSSSPCIDAGDPASDYSLEPTYNGRRINMGAYGGTLEATPSSPELSVVDTFNVGNTVRGSISFSTIYFKNDGTTRLNLDSLLEEIDTTFQITKTLPLEYIMPGDSTGIVIGFFPLNPGSYNETITLYTNDEDESIKQIKIMGNGVLPSPPVLSLRHFYFNEDETLTVHLDDFVEDADSPDSILQWHITFEGSSPDPPVSEFHFLFDSTLRSLQFWGDPNFFIDSILVFYAVTDDSGLTNNANNFISIISINDPPVAPEFLSYEPNLFEDTEFIINFPDFHSQLSDVETPLDQLNCELFPTANIFIKNMSEPNTYVMQCTPDWYGYDTLLIHISDDSCTVISRLPLFIQPVNDPPVITAIPDTVFNEDDSVKIDLKKYVLDIDTPDYLLNFRIEPDPLQSSLVTQFDTSSWITIIKGAPDEFIENVQIVYEVWDDHDSHSYDTNFVSILPINDVPVLLSLLDTTYFEDEKLIIPANYLLELIYDADHPDSLLSIDITKDSGMVFYKYDQLSISHQFWSNKDVDSSGYFTIQVQDPLGETLRQSFTVDIIPVNDAPALTGFPDTSAVQDSIFTLPLSDFWYDVDNQLTELQWAISANNSDIQITSGGDTLLCKPPEAYVGWDTVYAMLTDIEGLFDKDIFRIHFDDSKPPSFSIGVFQNPIATEHLDIYFFPNETIDSIHTLTISDESVVPDLITGIHPNPYHTHYRLRRSAVQHISITAADTTGNTGTSEYDFSTTYILKKAGGVVFSPDSVALFLLIKHTLKSNAYILCLPNTSDSSLIAKKPQLKLAKYAADYKEMDYTFTGPQTILSKNGKLNFIISEEQPQSMTSRPGVFKCENGKWKYLKTYTDAGRQHYWVYTNEFGRYALRFDAPEEAEQLPGEVSLAQNFPNPFNSTTTIQFELPELAGGVFESGAQLIIYDILGRKVMTLYNKPAVPGRYAIRWNGQNSHGQTIASGVYLYSLQYGNHQKTKKMVMIK
ncbi:MAG: choice-of-anchor D domain-containing protein [Candidatus Marinimicrobia bacterium]|nr:choice-of-anchor D domain-containing protein [Candidatus Neomarinimicrobiota bacterium]